jgi:hypothetical protein
MVLREIFGTKGEELIGDWMKLHNEKRYELHSTIILGNQIKGNAVSGTCSKNVEEEKYIQATFK